MTDAGLIAALTEAKRRNQHVRDCQVCEALAKMSEDARSEVESVIAGKLVGQKKLAQILTGNGYPVGRRAVDNHQKGHP